MKPKRYTKCVVKDELYATSQRNDDDGSMIGKLGRIEDLEQELGIDLMTLVEALMVDTTIYIKGKTTPCYYCEKWLSPDSGRYDLIVDDCGHINILELSDYGKTWALTMKELE